MKLIRMFHLRSEARTFAKGLSAIDPFGAYGVHGRLLKVGVYKIGQLDVTKRFPDEVWVGGQVNEYFFKGAKLFRRWFTSTGSTSAY